MSDGKQILSELEAKAKKAVQILKEENIFECLGVYLHEMHSFDLKDFHFEPRIREFQNFSTVDEEEEDEETGERYIEEYQVSGFELKIDESEIKFRIRDVRFFEDDEWTYSGTLEIHFNGELVFQSSVILHKERDQHQISHSLLHEYVKTIKIKSDWVSCIKTFYQALKIAMKNREDREVEAEITRLSNAVDFGDFEIES